MSIASLSDIHYVQNIRIRSFSGPHSVWMRENMDQKNFKYELFSRSDCNNKRLAEAYLGPNQTSMIVFFADSTNSSFLTGFLPFYILSKSTGFPPLILIFFLFWKNIPKTLHPNSYVLFSAFFYWILVLFFLLSIWHFFYATQK